MQLARALLVVSAVVFAITGPAYVFVPELAFAVVGIESGATTDFLLRTEGVALLAAGGFLAVLAARPSSYTWIALLALGGYYVVGSLVDLQAFAEGVVGPALVPSAVARITLGVFAGIAAWRVRTPATDNLHG